MDQPTQFIAGTLILLAADGALLAFGWRLGASEAAQSPAGLPLSTAITACCAALVVHIIAALCAGAMMDSNVMAGSLSIPIGVAPTLAFAWVLQHALAAAATRCMLEAQGDLQEDSDMAKARERIRQGDVEGAIREYQRCATTYQSSAPLFGLAALLEQQQRHAEAADAYRTIIKRFRDAPSIWTKGSQRLAEVLRDYLDDPQGADYILQAVHERNPETQYGFMPTEKATKSGDMVGSQDFDGKLYNLTRARALAKQGDVDEAVRLFRSYFEAQNVPSPRPLLEAASALQRHARYDDAAALLQEIMRTFQENGKAWGEAALRLATVQENHLRDRHAAAAVLREIQKHLPGSEHGRIATERLREL